MCSTTTCTFPGFRSGERGLLALEDLSPRLAAYEHGVPWFMEDDPILWWAPTNGLCSRPWVEGVQEHAQRAEPKALSNHMDRAFKLLMHAKTPLETAGTWISDEIVAAYVDCGVGVAHSVGSCRPKAAGLTPACHGRMFFGESMFSTATNASKVAFVHLVRWLAVKGWTRGLPFMNPHLASLGAESWNRSDFQAIWITF